MRDVIAFCTLMGCLIVFVASLAALIRPIPRVWLSNRKRAGVGLGIALFLFVLTAVIIPPPPPVQVERMAKSNSTAPKTVKASDDLTKSQDYVISFIRNAVMQTVSCKSDMDTTQRSIDKFASGDARSIDVYEDAKRGIKSCADASKEFGRSDAFDLVPADNQKAAKQALQKCDEAARGRKAAMTLAQKLLESDGPLAEVSKYLELKRTADTDEIFCRSGLLGVADHSKIPADIVEFVKS